MTSFLTYMDQMIESEQLSQTATWKTKALTWKHITAYKGLELKSQKVSCVGLSKNSMNSTSISLKNAPLFSDCKTTNDMLKCVSKLKNNLFMFIAP